MAESHAPKRKPSANRHSKRNGHAVHGTPSHANSEPQNPIASSNGDITNGPGEFTRLYRKARAGDNDAMNRMISIIDPELLRIARRMMSRERKDHTLSAEEVLNEAYVRLFRNGLITVEDKSHFIAIAYKRMEYFLKDYARSHNAKKNNGGVKPDAFSDALYQLPSHANTLKKLGSMIDIDRALTALEKIHVGWAKVVELRYFGDRTFKEIAEITGINQRTAERYWEHARHWLYNYMKDQQA